MTVLATDIDSAYCVCCVDNECECQGTDVALDGPDGLYVLCNCCAPVACECEGTHLSK